MRSDALGEDSTEREDIGATVDRLAAKLFGRDECSASGPSPTRSKPGEADVARCADDDVLRREALVNDPEQGSVVPSKRVGVRQSLGGPRCDARRGAPRKRSPGSKQASQRDARCVVGDDNAEPVEDTRIEDVHDPSVRKACAPVGFGDDLRWVAATRRATDDHALLESVRARARREEGLGCSSFGKGTHQGVGTESSLAWDHGGRIAQAW